MPARAAAVFGVDGAQTPVHAGSPGCSALPVTFTLTVAGAPGFIRTQGYKTSLNPVAFKAGEIITFSTAASTVAPQRLNLQENVNGVQFLQATSFNGMTIPTTTTYTIPQDGNYEFGAVIENVSPASGSGFTQLNVTCTPTANDDNAGDNDTGDGNTGDDGAGGDNTGDDNADNDETGSNDTNNEDSGDDDTRNANLSKARQQSNIARTSANIVYGSIGFTGFGSAKASALLDRTAVLSGVEYDPEFVKQEANRRKRMKELRSQIFYLETEKNSDQLTVEHLRERRAELEDELVKLDNEAERASETEVRNQKRRAYATTLSERLNVDQELKNIHDRNARTGKERDAMIKAAKAELRLLENPVHSVRGHVQGVIAPVAGPGMPARNFGGADPSAFQLTRHGDQSGSFFADLGKLMVTPARGPAPSPLADIDIWISGKVSILDDGSGAGRDGHSSNISAGGAMKLSERFAFALEVMGRFAEIDIDRIQSKTDMNGLGFALTGAMAVTDRIRLAVTGFYEHGWFDTSLAGATGAYDADRFGASAQLSGTFDAAGLVLQPAVALSYSHADVGGYTDSTSVAVPGQSLGYGNLNASLTVSRVLDGGELLVNWQPFVTARLHHDFRKEDGFAIAPNLVINDSNTNGEVGGGAMFRFEGGTSVSLAATYYGLFGRGANAVNVGANVGIPLN